MRRLLSGAFLVALTAWSAGYAAADSTKEEVTSSVVNANTVVWRIFRPVITQAQKSYTKIKFETGDAITLEAGGCDQTGGHGATWKRYVDPQGPNSDRLYHGLMRIPGATDSFKPSPTTGGKLVRLSDLGMKNLSPGQFNGKFVVGDLSAVPEKDRYLRLGFEDDGYSDNGPKTLKSIGVIQMTHQTRSTESFRFRKLGTTGPNLPPSAPSQCRLRCAFMLR